MRDALTLVVEPNGMIKAIYGDDLLPLIHQGNAVTTRASHVEPADGGGWFADMSPVGGVMLAGFETRAAALAAEVAYIESYVL